MEGTIGIRHGPQMERESFTRHKRMGICKASTTSLRTGRAARKRCWNPAASSPTLRRTDTLPICGFDRGEVLIEVHSPRDGLTTRLGPGAEPQFSPDGKWIAFTAVGGGRNRRPAVSRSRSAHSDFERAGSTDLAGVATAPSSFYFAPDKKLMAVDFNVETGRAGAPRELFQTRIVATSLAGFQYDVAPDGRFLIDSLPSGAVPLTLLTNWTAALKR